MPGLAHVGGAQGRSIHARRNGAKPLNFKGLLVAPVFAKKPVSGYNITYSEGGVSCAPKSALEPLIYAKHFASLSGLACQIRKRFQQELGAG